MRQGTDDMRLAPTKPLTDEQKNASLNDNLRKTGMGGIVMISMGIYRLGRAEVEAIMKKLAGDEGQKSVTPETERGNGIMAYGNREVHWEICYWNKEMDEWSEDPTDPTKTNRILTLMLGTEGL